MPCASLSAEAVIRPGAEHGEEGDERGPPRSTLGTARGARRRASRARLALRSSEEPAPAPRADQVDHVVDVITPTRCSSRVHDRDGEQVVLHDRLDDLVLVLVAPTEIGSSMHQVGRRACAGRRPRARRARARRPAGPRRRSRRCGGRAPRRATRWRSRSITSPASSLGVDRDELGRHEAAGALLLVPEQRPDLGGLLGVHLRQQRLGVLALEVLDQVGRVVGRHPLEELEPRARGRAPRASAPGPRAPSPRGCRPRRSSSRASSSSTPSAGGRSAAISARSAGCSRRSARARDAQAHVRVLPRAEVDVGPRHDGRAGAGGRRRSASCAEPSRRSSAEVRDVHAEHAQARAGARELQRPAPGSAAGPRGRRSACPSHCGRAARRARPARRARARPQCASGSPARSRTRGRRSRRCPGAASRRAHAQPEDERVLAAQARDEVVDLADRSPRRIGTGVPRYVDR